MAVEATTLQQVHIPTPVEARQILGGRLPSVLTQNTFERGLIVEQGKYYVPAYVASKSGFNELDKKGLDWLYEQLKQNGIFPLCPFQACSEYLNPSVMFDDSRTLQEQKAAWARFNDDVIPAVNYGLLMPISHFVVAVLEGQPIDEGVASEISHAHSLHLPVIGVRTDFRLGENVAAATNPAVDKFVPSQQMFTGPGAYERMFTFLHHASDEIIAQQLTQPSLLTNT